MDQSYIEPFIESTRNTFSTMFQTDVDVSPPEPCPPGGTGHDISGIIEMSGDVEGSVVLSFPIETARRVCSSIAGAEIGDDIESLSDAIGELVSMIAGGAKARFEGKLVSISCPSIVIGGQDDVRGPSGEGGILLPCTCDCGEFGVQVRIRQGAPVSDAAGGAIAG